ncbi:MULTISPECIES: hypothetical protein [Cyclobacterium]|jgi:hypothetical protein|uniref:Uncharacterized protein n=1 Tax=Cyclobacterium marinum (strain ATCC 25205 / DSM 745 / LMG 13164 / NCIMB 1802) TaxID=880070 RepID=G0J0E4_CYCMS|nr:hypothetical protein [Cyclobacterium marinum]AEL28217.1 hypothetical protein Cycma_4523 [Cyclobacterium marinum DSM 745]|tara:strand:+ start:21890 stop:22114 length:225 start_codon:yes stop_codon:yes gene_type:complete
MGKVNDAAVTSTTSRGIPRSLVNSFIENLNLLSLITALTLQMEVQPENSYGQAKTKIIENKFGDHPYTDPIFVE